MRARNVLHDEIKMMEISIMGKKYVITSRISEPAKKTDYNGQTDYYVNMRYL